MPDPKLLCTHHLYTQVFYIREPGPPSYYNIWLALLLPVALTLGMSGVVTGNSPLIITPVWLATLEHKTMIILGIREAKLYIPKTGQVACTWYAFSHSSNTDKLRIAGDSD